jgi:hypothetical protein
MGIAIGVLVVRVLCYRYADLSAILVGQVQAIYDTPTKAFFWAAVGLTYSYVASAPILTMHVSRMYLRKPSKRTIVFAMIFPVLACLLFVLGIFYRNYFSHQPGHIISWSILLAITVVHGFYCWEVATNIDKYYEFYTKLSKNRNKETDSGELIESYRHLREHGNSMLIVLCEVVLAVVLWGVWPESNKMHAETIIPTIAIALWIAPSSIAWFAGSIIERKFAEDQISNRSIHHRRKLHSFRSKI